MLAENNNPYRKVKILSVIAVALFVGVLYVFYLFGDKLNDYLLAGKMFHETSATVVKKERIVIDENNRRLTDDFGDQTEMPIGMEQWRVYHEIDSFDQIREPVRSRLVEFEKKRISEGRTRYSYKD